MKSELNKMLAGEPYDAFDPPLVEARLQARKKLFRLNQTAPDDAATQQQILSTLLGSVGANLTLETPFRCDYGSNIYLGENVYFNFDCVILDVCAVHVGDFVFFGPGVHIYTATHPLESELRRDQEFGREVHIGNDCWIGGRAIICPGVTIGPRTVIGAGSVVTKNIPPGVLAVGNPARVIRQIT
ncbi:sugar O-acetyltransferase [Stieleria sp. TO1_6]|uniref:sugar O-acetyltransferase n=1 Tax=Stieleria tagensis TaxID=2956795 RepID=UPI00209A990F|nr:sugar O-acetyltransferase [Stieleria tagensis]MCO8124762.1 sugar O-acetyltransferase [Stieleria tagensis]